MYSFLNYTLTEAARDDNGDIGCLLFTVPHCIFCLSNCNSIILIFRAQESKRQLAAAVNVAKVKF